MIKAKLATPLPEGLEVGRGNVVFLEGELRGGARVTGLEVAVGPNPAPALAVGIPPPGERVGSNWWQAIVPIAPVPAAIAGAVSLTVQIEGDTRRFDLGPVRLEPGSPGPVADRAPGRLVAVCMATHEPPPELLRAQIDSIRSQTYRDWVCVISDDASSDAARAEIEAAIAGDDRFSIELHDQRIGFYRNFERALGAVPAEAGYVALCDQDDRWHADKLASLVAALGPDDVLAHSDARVVDAADGRVVAETFWPRGAPRDDRLGDLLFANAVTGASALFRTEALSFVLPFPGLAGRAFHDRWIALVSRALGGIAYVERPLFDYVQHRDAAHGHALATGRQSSAVRALGERTAALRSRGFHPDWRAAHDDYLARSVSEAIALRLRVSERLGAGDRRRLRMIEALPRSPAAQARVAARWLARAPRGRPGIEGALVRGVLWRRMVGPRNALARRREARERVRGGTPGRARLRSAARPRYGITVTQGGEQAGFGDYFTARELGDALERTGAEVVYLELDGGGWRRDARALDVIVSLLDRFPLREAPPGSLTVAWVRNWAERWLLREWFDEYDQVFATSETSCRLIREGSSSRPQLMPLATNPARFHRVEPDPEFSADLAFIGSHWGVERDVRSVLPRLASNGLDVKVFGHGWDEVPGMRELSRGPVSYDVLPRVYSSAAVVVDDSAPHTRPYRAVNSRVFDALACGAFVVTNDVEGVHDLFGDGFPTWSDAASLEAHAELATGDPAKVAEIIEPLRRTVIDEHTYARRARQLREAIGDEARPRAG